MNEMEAKQAQGADPLAGVTIDNRKPRVCKSGWHDAGFYIDDGNASHLQKDGEWDSVDDPPNIRNYWPTEAEAIAFAHERYLLERGWAKGPNSVSNLWKPPFTDMDRYWSIGDAVGIQVKRDADQKPPPASGSAKREHVWGPRLGDRPGVRCVNCFQAAAEPHQNFPCEAEPVTGLAAEMEGLVEGFRERAREHRGQCEFSVSEAILSCADKLRAVLARHAAQPEAKADGVGESEADDFPVSRVESEFTEQLERMFPQPPSPAAEQEGRPLPDAPGRWTREDGKWDVLVDYSCSNGMCYAAGWSDGQPHWWHTVTLPRGHWFPAQPSGEKLSEMRFWVARSCEQQSQFIELGDMRAAVGDDLQGMVCWVFAKYREQINALTTDLAAAVKFKTYVHATLDSMGVPEDPDPEHNKAHGCRISGRLKWLQERLAAAVKAKEDADAKRDREWLEAIHPGNADTLLGQSFGTPEKYRQFSQARLVLESEDCAFYGKVVDAVDRLSESVLGDQKAWVDDEDNMTGLEQLVEKVTTAREELERLRQENKQLRGPTATLLAEAMSRLQKAEQQLNDVEARHKENVAERDQLRQQAAGQVIRGGDGVVLPGNPCKEYVVIIWNQQGWVLGGLHRGQQSLNAKTALAIALPAHSQSGPDAPPTATAEAKQDERGKGMEWAKLALRVNEAGYATPGEHKLADFLIQVCNRLAESERGGA